MQVGEKVVVNDNMMIVREGEDILVGKEAVIQQKDDYIFPIVLRFKEPHVQKVYQNLGERRFDEFELTKK